MGTISHFKEFKPKKNDFLIENYTIEELRAKFKTLQKQYQDEALKKRKLINE